MQLSRLENGFGFTCSAFNQGLVTVLNVTGPSEMKKGNMYVNINNDITFFNEAIIYFLLLCF